MTGRGDGLPSNVVPVPRRPGAFVPVYLPGISREQWNECFALVCLASAIMGKDRGAVAHSASMMIAMEDGDGDGNGDGDGLSSFLSQLIEASGQLGSTAAMLNTAGARLALAAGRQEEWLSLQEDTSDDITA